MNITSPEISNKATESGSPIYGDSNRSNIGLFNDSEPIHSASSSREMYMFKSSAEDIIPQSSTNVPQSFGNDSTRINPLDADPQAVPQAKGRYVDDSPGLIEKLRRSGLETGLLAGLMVKRAANSAKDKMEENQRERRAKEERERQRQEQREREQREQKEKQRKEKEKQAEDQENQDDYDENSSANGFNEE